MKTTNFLIVLIFPLACFADGIKISEFTLESVKMAFLVKVLVYNSLKNTAKIKILKKYSKIKEIKPQLPQPSPHKDSVQSNEVGSDEAPLNELPEAKVDEIFTVRIKPRRKAVANKWVEDIRYWNQADSAKEGSEAILLDVNQGFVFSPASKQNNEKFEMLFDDYLLHTKITNATVTELIQWAQDRDYEEICITQLIKKDAINADYVSNISDLGAMQRIIEIFLKTTSGDQRTKFWFELAKIKSKQSIEIQRQFLQTFYYAKDNSLEQKISIFELFDQKHQEIRYQTGLLFYEARDKLAKKDFSILSKIKLLYLNYMNYNSDVPSELRPSNFFEHLPESESIDFLESLSTQLVSYSRENSHPGRYDAVISEFNKNENLKIAWILSQMDFRKIQSNISEPLFNRVLKVLFQKTDLTNPENKNKIFKFSEIYLSEAQYPYKLNPDVYEAYVKNGGIVYGDLPQLRLTHQNNLPELAAKFTYYFETALFVDVVELKHIQNKSTLKIKILKRLGNLKEKNQSYPHVSEICDKANDGKILLLAIDEDSWQLLEKLKLKKFYLATKAASYNFLIFDESFEKQIEKSFSEVN